MNKLKIIISYILIVLLFPIKVYASSGSLDGFELNGTYLEQYQAYTYNNGDDNALPTGFKYYYKLTDGKVIYMERSEVVANILNSKVGVVLSPSRLLQFIGDYNSQIVGRNPNYYNELKPVLKGGALVGVALNGLTGGLIDTSGTNKNVSIPSTEVNNVYNYYQYWSENEGLYSPDYVILNGTTKSQMIGGLTGSQIEVCTNAINTASEPIFINGYDKGGTTEISFSTNIDNFRCIYMRPNVTIVCPTLSNMAASFGLSAQNYTLSWNDYKTKSAAGYICKLYDKTSKQQVAWSATSYRYGNTTVVNTENYQNDVFLFSCGSSYLTAFTGMITIYKSIDVIQQITNNVYQAPEYKTNNNTNFNVNNDNTYNTTTNQINNSTQDNDNIYNTANTENNTIITEQITNTNNTTTNIDQSQIITNTTTIVNNYYQNNYGSGGNDNPDNPDNPSGGGGGLEDDSILDALLAAILKLLRAIGKIIATILTGIIDIITEVLTAITNITTSFTSIIEFIGSIFGFLPAECIAVLTLGLTISVLIALIKMFGK